MPVSATIEISCLIILVSPSLHSSQERDPELPSSKQRANSIHGFAVGIFDLILQNDQA